MTQFHQFVTLCRRLEASPRRLDKLRLVAEFLRTLDAGEVGAAVAYLTGRPFPASEPRVLGVRGLPVAGPPPVEPSLTLAEVTEAFVAVADASGAGSRRIREERLAELAARATEDERALLARIIAGEMRTGVSDGLVLEAIGMSAGAELAAVRRAALFLGDLSAVAALARSGGAAALTAATPQLFVPLLPMLAELATDFDTVLAAHGGRTALEYKYDGARIQLHRDGDRVAIWTRRLSEVTASLPDVVDIARRELSGAPFILDGEVVALDASRRPLPFQDLMRRFRRVHGVEALAREMPLALHFFDCLVADGSPLVDAPYERRWEALTAVTRGRYLALRSTVDSAEAGREFFARALAAGHEGVMAKDPGSPYEPGGRGKRWFKLKEAQSLDWSSSPSTADRAAAPAGSRTITWPCAMGTASPTSARRSRGSRTASSAR